MMTILIGYDGSDGARDALEWAAREAGLRGTSLTICHVWRAPLPDRAMLPNAVPVRRAAERLTAEAMRDAHKTVPYLALHPVTRCGSVASVLLEQAGDAELVVIGQRGHDGLHGIVTGSVSSRVARHAPVPVVVVRGASEPPPEAGRIVVGFDGSAPGEAALAFAFREASLHGVPLTVVGVWPPRASVHGAPFVDEVFLRAAAHDRFLAAISARQADFPDVETHSWFPDGAPVSELLAAAAPARLLVVGEHDAHGMRAWFPDSLLRSLLHNAPCPIAVVHRTPRSTETIDPGDTVPTAFESA